MAARRSSDHQPRGRLFRTQHNNRIDLRGAARSWPVEFPQSLWRFHPGRWSSPARFRRRQSDCARMHRSRSPHSFRPVAPLPAGNRGLGSATLPAREKSQATRARRSRLPVRAACPGSQPWNSTQPRFPKGDFAPRPAKISERKATALPIYRVGPLEKSKVTAPPRGTAVVSEAPCAQR
jgi:hypothetical protein